MKRIVNIGGHRVLVDEQVVGPSLTDVDTGAVITLAKWMGRSNGYMPAKGKIRTVKAGLKSGAWKLM